TVLTFTVLFSNPPPTTELYTLSLHDALPISRMDLIRHSATRDLRVDFFRGLALWWIYTDHIPGDVLAHVSLRNFATCDATEVLRSEEHTSELQSPYDLVCRLLLENKKQTLQV